MVNPTRCMLLTKVIGMDNRLKSLMSQPSTNGNNRKARRQHLQSNDNQPTGDNRQTGGQQFRTKPTNNQSYDNNRPSNGPGQNLNQQYNEAPIKWPHEQGWCLNHRRYGASTRNCIPSLFF